MVNLTRGATLGTLVALGALALVAPACGGGTAGDARGAHAAALAPTGTLRAVFLGANPVQGRVDPQTGAASGTVPDLVEELARTLGVPFTIASAPNAAGVMAALDEGSADVGFLAYDAARAEDVDFGPAFLVMYSSYLVRADSPLQRNEDVDRAGVTVGAVKGQTQELFVSRELGNATLRLFEATPPQAELEALLAAGGVDAFALNRQRSLEAQAAAPAALRALDESFLEVDQSFVVRKGDRAKLDALDTFIAGVRASKFVEASIERAKLRGVAASLEDQRSGQ